MYALEDSLGVLLHFCTDHLVSSVSVGFVGLIYLYIFFGLSSVKVEYHGSLTISHCLGESPGHICVIGVCPGQINYILSSLSPCLTNMCN